MVEGKACRLLQDASFECAAEVYWVGHSLFRTPYISRLVRSWWQTGAVSSALKRLLQEPGGTTVSRSNFRRFQTSNPSHCRRARHELWVSLRLALTAAESCLRFPRLEFLNSFPLRALQSRDWSPDCLLADCSHASTYLCASSAVEVDRFRVRSRRSTALIWLSWLT